MQVKYSMFLSPNSLADKEACDQLFQKRVNDFADSLCMHENSPKLFHAGSRYIHIYAGTDLFAHMHVSQIVVVKASNHCT